MSHEALVQELDSLLGSPNGEPVTLTADQQARVRELQGLIMRENLPKSFSVRCVRGVDQGMCATDCIDEFEILGDGQPVFSVTFDYGMDVDKQTMTVEALSILGVDDLPFMHSGFQLGFKLMQFLDELLSEQDKEFYADCFHDEEGESVMYSINKMIFGGK